MNIDPANVQAPPPQARAGVRRLDLTVSDPPARTAAPARTAVAPAAPAPQQVTSTRQLQEVLSAEEVRALAQAFGAVADRIVASPTRPAAGIYTLRGTSAPPRATGRAGGLLDLTG
ncbi:MAG: hypothetical protein AB1505_33850 [Candidatus Latescibacterota bacterium]